MELYPQEMQPGDLRRWLEVAQDGARVVGHRMREGTARASTLDVRLKGRIDLVTEVDEWADAYLREHIRQHFPEHRIVSEENASQEALSLDEIEQELTRPGLCWVIDPLDGTTNFAHGIPHAAVSIALTCAGKPLVATIYDPYRDELFSAIRGDTATLNGEPIRVTQRTAMLEAVVAIGFPYDKAERWSQYRNAYEAILTKTRAVRRFGAAALDLCWVAAGRFDAFFEFGLKAWDIAAGSLIIESAGGVAANPFDGKADFSVCAGSFLFANSELHAHLLRELRDAYVEPDDE